MSVLWDEIHHQTRDNPLELQQRGESGGKMTWESFKFNMFKTKFTISDKFVHSLGSFASTMALPEIGVNLWVSAGLVLLGGIGKEFKDYVGINRRFDWYDIYANIFGIGFAILLHLI